MTKKRLKLLRNYVYASNRIDKINNAKILVEEFGFFPQVKNNGLHFHWKEMTYEFNFWPTTEKFHITSNGETRFVLGASSIVKALEEYENELFIKEG
jgi:hypothetical protein